MLFKGIAVISAAAAVLSLVIMRRLYLVPVIFALCFAALFLLWALSCAVCALFVNKEKPCKAHSPLFRFYANCIIDSLMQLMRIKLHVSGEDILPREKFLFVGNHRSSMDPIIEMGVMRKYNIGFVAKRELFEIPVIGKIMHKCFCLSLNRGRTRDEVNTILQAIDIIRSQTASVGIYPEGTRNRGEGLLPFKSGAFKIAQKAECPIVVGFIRNSDRITKNAPFKRTDVYLEFAGVLSAGYIAQKGTAEISEAARSMLKKRQEVKPYDESNCRCRRCGGSCFDSSVYSK
ncbi:MAG: lysophospholipid acyltransferase family protein [Candidatus Ornithomonoglobus sp.]